MYLPNFLYQEVIRHHNFRGRFGVVALPYFDSHTYNYYLVNDQRTLISSKLETRTIILGMEGVVQCYQLDQQSIGLEVGSDTTT